MTRQVIHVQYDGVWNLDEGVYKWIPHSNETTSIFVDDSMKYQEFMKKLHGKFCMGKDDIGLKVSYMPNPGWRFAPITIRSDECLSCYLFQCEKQSYNILLCVEVVEKIETEKVYKDCEVEENQMSCDNFENNINMEENSCDVVPTPRNAMGDDGYDFVLVPENTIMNDGCDRMDSCLSPPIPPKEGLEVPECNEPEDIVDQSRNDEVFCFTDESDLAIGQEFENKQEVKAKLHDVALNACFEMAIKISTKSLYVVKCIDPNCKWAVRAAKVSNSERFSIRTYCNTHTCSLINRKRKNRQASASLVGMMVKSNFECQKEIPNPQTIMTMMKNRNVQISYWKAWRGKRVAQDLLMGSPKVSFTYLPSYLYMVEKMNPGTVTHIKVDDNEKFKYVFVAYEACIRGFQCMRKVIAVDGTWLKSKYRGVLLLATAQDGNFQQYPLAWAVVDSENDASWLWFFTKLQELIPDEEELVIISDRNQSIINGVNSVYKKSQYGHCRWHISQNIRARVRVSGVVKAFERTANAYKVSTFDSRYRELRNKYPRATKYLDESLDVKKWARSHFPGSRYNIMTTNGAESINAVLRDAREYPIISLLDAIKKTTEWFNKRRNASISVETSETPLTPKAEEIIRERFVKASGMSVNQLNLFEFQVTGKCNDSIIDFGQKSCSCRVFDIDKLPCVHAIAAYEQAGVQIYDLCSEYYKLATWTLAYAETVYPVPQQLDWHIPENLELMKVTAPDVPRKRGRAQKHRFPSVGEVSTRKRKSVSYADILDTPKRHVVFAPLILSLVS